MFVLTFQLMLFAVLLAAAVGIIGAWAAWTVQQSGRIGRFIAGIVFAGLVAALALPMILHAAAWEATAGKFGWLPLTQAGVRVAGETGYGGIFGMFHGLVACGWIHGIHGAALVTLATWHGVRRVPESIVQQSQMDLGPVRSWWAIRLPIAFPWVVTALLATAALAATEMTVADLYGYRTVADRFYLQFASDPTLTNVAQTCCLPLLFSAAILFGVGSILNRNQAVQDADPVAVSMVTASAIPRWLAVGSGVIAIMVVATIAAVPFIGLVVKVGHEVVVLNDERFVSWSVERCTKNLIAAPGLFSAEYQWTIVVSLLTAVVAVPAAWLVASLGRVHRRSERVFDVLTIVCVLIPGPIVGLCVVRVFQIDLPFVRQLYNASLVPTVIGLLFRAGPVAYWVFRVGYRGIGQSVLDASRLEMSWIARVWRVDRPLLKRTLVAASLTSALVASGDVPAMLPIIPPGVTTVGTRLFEQLHSGARYQEASLAIWYVAVVTIVAAFWARSVGPKTNN